MINKMEGTLASGRPFWIEQEQPCPMCDQWLTANTVMHGPQPGVMCKGTTSNSRPWTLAIYVARAYRHGQKTTGRWSPNRWVKARGAERREARERWMEAREAERQSPTLNPKGD